LALSHAAFAPVVPGAGAYPLSSLPQSLYDGLAGEPETPSENGGLTHQPLHLLVTDRARGALWAVAVEAAQSLQPQPLAPVAPVGLLTCDFLVNRVLLNAEAQAGRMRAPHRLFELVGLLWAQMQRLMGRPVGMIEYHTAS
jgi:hypothetical protein